MNAPDPALLARRLFVLFKAAAVYGPGNEGYRSHAAEARETLSAALRSANAVRLEGRDDRLFFNGEPIRMAPGEAGASFLLAELRRSGAGGLEFREGAARELDAFVFAFHGAGARRPRTLEQTERILRDAGVAAISPLPSPGAEEAGPEPAFGAVAARRTFRRAVETVSDLMARARAGRDPDLDAARSAADSLAEQVVEDPQALFELSILQSFDEYTYAHCVSVSVYATAIGERLGLDRVKLSELGFGALFHDLGKARLPRALIDKPDEFTEDDWRLMRRHPEFGAETLLNLRRPLDARLARAVTIAFEHHLGLDGSGYPKLATPRRQDLFSRICAVADSFDAMTSGRVYAKRTMSPDEALRRMVQRAGTAYDTLVLRLFINAAGVFPIGTAVLLDSGERAVVRRNAEDLLRPEVVIVGTGGESKQASVRRTLDPREHGIDAREILRDHQSKITT